MTFHLFSISKETSDTLSLNNPESFAELVGELEGFIDEEVDPRGLPQNIWKDHPITKN
jgi:hypothetical protein